MVTQHFYLYFYEFDYELKNMFEDSNKNLYLNLVYKKSQKRKKYNL